MDVVAQLVQVDLLDFPVLAVRVALQDDFQGLRVEKDLDQLALVLANMVAVNSLVYGAQLLDASQPVLNIFLFVFCFCFSLFFSVGFGRPGSASFGLVEILNFVILIVVIYHIVYNLSLRYFIHVY